jgi:hypothetical protein
MDVTLYFERFAQFGLAAVYFAGFVLGVVFWSRHPMQSLLFVLASGLLLAVEIFMIGTWLVTDELLDDVDFVSIINGCESLARIVAFGLLAAAAFTGRSRRKSDEYDLLESRL